MNDESQADSKVEWLSFLLAAVTLAALVAVYLLLDRWRSDGDVWVRLTLNVLPNLVAGLVIVLTVYWLFKRKAIPTIAALTRAASPRTREAESDLARRGVKAFYEKFGQTPWPSLLMNAASVDIVTWYFDSWIRNHREEIRQFFSRGGRLRLVLPDPRDPAILALTQERYPELDSDDARKKIANTGLKLHELAVESGSKSARVEVVLSTRVLSYSSIRFDGDTVVLSVFDQFRTRQIDSPALLLDLRRSSTLRAYWDKEIGGFFEIGQSVDAATLRAIYAGG